eukprot:TRINITY_DN12128_c0_g1_i1.p2 TRINITY_DN12128_c0_g1~~TRINITY_DN12128_c0_g1_i1.p2  ORF type:complete len:188 (-),score=34.57 TRINITY_DN12128_c0_g1_i1:681-1223(-)
MDSLSASVGSPLSKSDVRSLVETVSSAIRLEDDGGKNGGKGRYLVARRALRAGEVVLRERPIFAGRPDGDQSRKAFTSEFVALADKDLDDVGDDDCLHPCSPLVDCVADILLAKQRALNGATDAEQARAKLRFRQLAALCRPNVPQPLPEDCAQELLAVLTPELRELTTEHEIRVVAQCG